MAYVLSSISGNLISAASAGFAPTNGADVSAIASAYQVVSATATQLNAGTAYVTSINETPISAARAGNAANASLANSAWYDGTGRVISSLPDEAAVSSIASAYAESAASSKLDESATADFYSTANPSGFITGVDLSDYATTAYVDSSVSSFVDSAYVESQVSSKQDTLTFDWDADSAISSINGSALAGQGGGGGLVTAIGTSESGITSINNSSLVDTAALRSADYSSLYVQEPLYISASGDSSYIGISGGAGGIDSATCSAIASAYAESAASGKLDTTAQVVTATGSASAMMMGGTSYYASQINGLNISAQKANVADEWMHAGNKLDATASAKFYTTANESGYVDSAYVESQVSSKQDTLTFDWDADSAISSINGSALAGQGGVTGEYVENSALDSATAHSATGSLTTLATGVSSISGQPLIPTYLANPTYQYGGQSTFVYMPASSIWTTADVATGIFSPLQYATGACLAMDAANFKAYYKGNEWFVSNTAYGYARGEVHQSRGSRVIVEHTGGAGAVLSAKNNQANVTLNSTAYGTAQMAVGSSQAYVQVQRGDSASKYNSAKLDTDYLKFYNGMTTGYLDPEDTASGTSYLPAETEYMYISSIPYWNGKADSSALSSYALSADVSGTVDLVSTQSANWGGSALALSAGPGVKLEKVGDTLVVSTDGAVINEETIAGTWNGNTVYQMLLSGTGQTPGTSNIALPAALISTSIASKWIDPSNSYILYGTTGNRLPSTWVLGEGRYGSLDIIDVNVTMRSTDNGTNNCSAFFNVKYIKAEA